MDFRTQIPIDQPIESTTSPMWKYTNELNLGETTILVPQVYPVCAIGPSSLKRAQLVP